MDYGRLSGKLYSHPDWLGMSSECRELLVTAWSWAIDHEIEDGEVSYSTLESLSMGLGHVDNPYERNLTPSKVVDSLVTWEWIEPVTDPKTGEELAGIYRFTRWWDVQRELIRKTRERREKERQRYLRRKEQKDG